MLKYRNVGAINKQNLTKTVRADKKKNTTDILRCIVQRGGSFSKLAKTLCCEFILA